MSASLGSTRNGGTELNRDSVEISRSASSASICASLPRNCRWTGPGHSVTAVRNAWRSMSGKRSTESTVALNFVTGSKAGTSLTSWYTPRYFVAGSRPPVSAITGEWAR